jgi:small-conductance mechanosensitive channel
LNATAEGARDDAGPGAILDGLIEWLNTDLMSLGGAPVTPGKILLAIVVIAAAVPLANAVRRLVERRMAPTAVTSDAVQLIARVVFYAIVGVAAMTAIGILGVPLTAFAFVSGAIAIGVGFGAQNINTNFISGWILMGERPIRIGDFVELQDARGTVEQIHNRYTRIRRVDGVHMLVPNSWILENTVINWTLVDRKIRTAVAVGVEYGAPVQRVHDLMLAAVAGRGGVLAEPAPRVYFEDFGDNALMFEAVFWCEAASEKDARGLRSEIRFAIDAAFAAESIVIAFPQRDVHIDGTLRLERGRSER